MKKYIFLKNEDSQFTMVEVFNNEFKADYSYDVWKDKLKDQATIIDNVEQAREVMTKGFDPGDCFLCIDAKNVYDRLHPLLYFSTMHSKDFFHYLRVMKDNFKIEI